MTGGLKPIKGYGWLWVVGIGIIILAVSLGPIKKEFHKDKARNQPRAAVDIPYASLHTFPEGENRITIPIGPERWEGVALPLDATAYDVDATVWRQIKMWNGKYGPILKKGESAYITIPRNRNISEATFWVRGEGEATITIERR